MITPPWVLATWANRMPVVEIPKLWLRGHVGDVRSSETAGA
jgi:hypothetical protein